MRSRLPAPRTSTHARLFPHQATPLVQSAYISSAVTPPTPQIPPLSGPAPRAMRKGSGGSRRSRWTAGSGPVPGAVPVGVPASVLGFPSRSRRCPRPFLPFVAVAAAVAILYAAWPGAERSSGKGGEAPPRLRSLPSSEKHLRTLLGGFSPLRFRDAFLRPLLRERPPGSAGSHAVRQHITDHLSALRAGWQLNLDTFSSPTPRGTVTFSNLVATLSPSAPRRLALVCHYDTKVLPSPGPAAFIGATDSAVPCAMLMEVAAALDGPLRNAKEGDAEVTLQLLFLDGEEAFEEWSATDSLYGARHLAARMAATRHGAHGTELSAMVSIPSTAGGVTMGWWHRGDMEVAQLGWSRGAQRWWHHGDMVMTQPGWSHGAQRWWHRGDMVVAQPGWSHDA
ncbi:glutaminyl-peptide cyclotransferase-like protein isoform X1 [Lagopus muta]|uniref:glutaminyl-peptide cyclotransferase-like protein isoform X1 n=1 Tax=Lagopus muta TaxID=64668 RepID=UPI00209E5901|nr:glutaminyl-peptide cyclotransferase-like protein isoform X1 [Lagopus muta]